MPRSSADDELARRQFVADPDVLAGLELSVDDLADPDLRSYVIRHEHPEFEDALEDDVGEIDLGYGPINPRLHLTMHEIVATQLWDGEPPEVWETAVRLGAAGYERHEILHMLSRPVSDQVWAALRDQAPYDKARHVAACEPCLALGSGSDRPWRPPSDTTTNAKQLVEMHARRGGEIGVPADKGRGLNGGSDLRRRAHDQVRTAAPRADLLRDRPRCGRDGAAGRARSWGAPERRPWSSPSRVAIWLTW